MSNSGPGRPLSCRIYLYPQLNTPFLVILKILVRFFQVCLIGDGAKLCRTVALQDRSCPSLLYSKNTYQCWLHQWRSMLRWSRQPWSGPFPKTFLSLGGRSKFWRPPWTDISSVGNSSCHSFTMRCSKLSGLVSYDTRIYCKRYWIIRLVLFLTVVLEWNMFISSLRELC